MIANPRLQVLYTALPLLNSRHRGQVEFIIKALEIRDIYLSYTSLRAIASHKEEREMSIQSIMGGIEGLDEQAIADMRGFLEDAKGKSMGEVAAMLGDLQQKLPFNKDFSAEEREAIIESALNHLPDSDKNKFKTILNLMNSE